MGISDDFVDYQLGKMSDDQIVLFFQHLIDTGMIENLDSSYREVARLLTKAGFCTNSRPMNLSR